jgi:hypothetical protein
VKVLVACEFSGIVRDAFLARGHNAWSCDLLPTESPIQNGHTRGHLIMNALQAITLAHWDLMIAHPPCTYLTNAGVRWLYKNGKGSEHNEERWENMRAACQFFNALADCSIPRICIENPIMHSWARESIGIAPTQTIQPWMFGHAETKATCLWLKNLPKLDPTDVIKPDFEKYPRRVQLARSDGAVKQGRGSGFATRIIGGGGYEPRVHHASPGPERWKNRSRTLTGIAAAMAEQWGALA